MWLRRVLNGAVRYDYSEGVMNRRKFLTNGAMAIVAASVVPAAVLAESHPLQFGKLPQSILGSVFTGGIVPSVTYIIGEHVSESMVTREQMARIEAQFNNLDYYVHHANLLYTGNEPKKKLEFRP